MTKRGSVFWCRRVVLCKAEKVKTAYKYGLMPFHENRVRRKFSSLTFK